MNFIEKSVYILLQQPKQQKNMLNNTFAALPSYLLINKNKKYKR